MNWNNHASCFVIISQGCHFHQSRSICLAECMALFLFSSWQMRKFKTRKNCQEVLKKTKAGYTLKHIEGWHMKTLSLVYNSNIFSVVKVVKLANIFSGFNFKKSFFLNSSSVLNFFGLFYCFFFNCSTKCHKKTPSISHWINVSGFGEVGV